MARQSRDLQCPEVSRPEDGPLTKRLAWMALIWVVSVVSLGIVSLIIRWWLK